MINVLSQHIGFVVSFEDLTGSVKSTKKFNRFFCRRAIGSTADSSQPAVIYNLRTLKYKKSSKDTDTPKISPCHALLLGRDTLVGCDVGSVWAV